MIFSIICVVFEKFWCVQELFEHFTFNYTPCISLLQLHFICTIALSIFSTHFILKKFQLLVNV
jgi:hypothetical protein